MQDDQDEHQDYERTLHGIMAEGIGNFRKARADNCGRLDRSSLAESLSGKKSRPLDFQDESLLDPSRRRKPAV